MSNEKINTTKTTDLNVKKRPTSIDTTWNTTGLLNDYISTDFGPSTDVQFPCVTHTTCCISSPHDTLWQRANSVPTDIQCGIDYHITIVKLIADVP